MKNRQLKSDLARIKAVIEGDRRNVSCDVENMLKYDLSAVLSSYFEMCLPPQIAITTAKGGVSVRITMRAKSVKAAGRVPQEA